MQVMSEEYRVEIANTIMQQIGGNKFKVMVGARSIYATDTGVQFQIGRGARQSIKLVKIDLTPMDEYEMRFFKVYGGKATEVEVREMLHAEDLENVFAEVTGMATRLF